MKVVLLSVLAVSLLVVTQGATLDQSEILCLSQNTGCSVEDIDANDLV